MKRRLYFLSCFFLSIACFNAGASAQSLRDKTFNVIDIDRNDVTASGGNYLIDLPLPGPATIPVFYNSAMIPVQTLLYADNFYPELQTFILISPDWDYYARVADMPRKSGIVCAEPVTTTLLYKVKRENGRNIITDSLVVRGDQPQINRLSKPVISAGKILVYFSESYGSVCCPRDAKWDMQPDRDAFIMDFERQHQVKVGGTYSLLTGKEGEHTVHYSLAGLNGKQKLDFIVLRSLQLIPNGDLKDMVFMPEVYTPQLVDKQRLKPVTEK